MTLQALTANRLSDGAVVYLDENGVWDVEMTRARTAEEEADIAALEQVGVRSEAAQLVVGAYLFDVARTEDGVVPMKNKERIRALGPTVQLVLNQSRNNPANQAAA